MDDIQKIISKRNNEFFETVKNLTYGSTITPPPFEYYTNFDDDINGGKAVYRPNSSEKFSVLREKEEKPKGPSKMATELAKQIIAWQQAGHSMYPIDVLNMMIDANVIKVEDLKTIIEEYKKNPVAPKIPTTYIKE